MLKMYNKKQSKSSFKPSRRDFIKSSAPLLLTGMMLERSAHAAGSDTLRIGLIGCGSRGTGAVLNALRADANAKLTAMADMFDWRIESSLKQIEKEEKDRAAVDKEHRFVGFDAYKQLISSGVDVVLIAVPSFFAPIHLKAAIDAGKHVFCEKPHAIDAKGVKMVINAGETAKKKGLCMVSGLAWRYHTGLIETMKRVHDGAIGEIIAVEEICNTPSLPVLPRKPGFTEMEYQIHNWLNFYWLSGDLTSINLIHDVDKGAWALRDRPPLKAWGMGGREVRREPIYGDVYDHHATVFEYADGIKMFAYCRQQNGCTTEISDRFQGTRGRCDLMKCRIEGEKAWQYEGPECNRFDLEHVALFNAIRSGKPLNNGLYMARSSMMAIMSTFCSYTGKEITWEDAMNLQQHIAPETFDRNATPPTLPGPDGSYPVPVPGITKFV